MALLRLYYGLKKMRIVRSPRGLPLLVLGDGLPRTEQSERGEIEPSLAPVRLIYFSRSNVSAELG